MRIIPVIDLQAGQVVHARLGDRTSYQPLQTILADDPTPKNLGRALVERLGFREVYVADLDAISGETPAWSSYQDLFDCGLSILLDAGVRGAHQAEEILRMAGLSNSLQGLVCGLESLSSPYALQEVLGLCGPDRTIFSLDLKRGQPLTRLGVWSNCGPKELVREVFDLGIRRSIVLDLARVGSGMGTGTEDLCRWMKTRFPEMEVIAGGGVRTEDDLQVLQQIDCNAALVASAIHAGTFTRSVVSEWNYSGVLPGTHKLQSAS
ncbi:Phosphoribosylformimino-5-aminoimidazole carboxamide ribotide isomerase [Planctomycetales bacterium 10988]|nr:Phosphoribosylformimino-5-aminoimidazole carboxamide ribotide isomerase [Planctomycetales bacterium 10988]